MLTLPVLAVLLVRKRFLVVTVDGASMSPTLVNGKRVLVRRCAELPPTGAIVLLAGTEGRWLIKRLIAAPGEPLPAQILVAQALPPGTVAPPGYVAVLGDHPRSVDSKQYGCVPATRILGVVR